MKIASSVVVIAVAIQVAIAEKPPVKDEPPIGQVYLDPDIVGKLAATMAAMLANIEAKKRFNVEPFSAASAKAVFHGNRWEWKATVGYGKGDLQAIVSFAQDGAQPKVEIMPLTSELQRQF